jgi:hypothetical protein
MVQTLVIPAFRRLRQKACKFKASLGYIVRPCLKISKQTNKQKTMFNWALVAHTCNPSYSGGRDQEDLGSKPTKANSSRDSVSKKKKKSQK